MKLCKFQIAIGTIFLASMGIAFAIPAIRVDCIYIGQFLILSLALFRIPKRHRPLQIISGTLIFADLVYYGLVYKMNLPTSNLWVSLVTSSLFGLCFGYFNFIVWKNNRQVVRQALKNRIDIPALAFFVLVAGVYILMPGGNKLLQQGFSPENFSHLITLVFSLPLVLLSYLLLTSTNDVEDQVVLSGFFILGILDIGIQLETIRYGNLSFSFYDVLWFSAVFLISTQIKHFNYLAKIDSGRSIINLTKKVFLLSGLIPITICLILVKYYSDISPVYFIFILISFFLLGIISSNFIQLGIAKYDKELIQLQNQPSIHNLSEIMEKSPKEFRNSISVLYKSFLEKEIVKYQEHQRTFEKTNEVYKRMAHDIASPLSVLQIVSCSEGEFDDEKKKLLGAATQRIRQISKDIMNRKLSNSLNTSVTPERMSFSEVLRVTADIIMEKEVEFAQKIIRFEFEPSCTNETRSICAETSAYSRILSNLLNNSFRALGEISQPQIILKISSSASRVRIHVADNGPGFPDEVLRNKMKFPLSIGKEGGYGIGLFSASSNLEKWNGSISIFNDNGAHAVIELTFAESLRFVEKTEYSNL